MSKLRYKEGGVWKSIAPSQKEFDDNKAEVTASLADTEKLLPIDITKYGAIGDGIKDSLAAFDSVIAEQNTGFITLVNDGLSTDANADGVVDNWTKYLGGAAITGAFTVSGGQTMTVTGSTAIGGNAIYKDISATFGDNLYFDLTYTSQATAGNYSPVLLIQALDATNSIIKQYTNVNLANTATEQTYHSPMYLIPSGATKLRVYLMSYANAIGGTGTVTYKNFILNRVVNKSKSSVLKFPQNEQNNAVYYFSATPVMDNIQIDADKGVVLSFPTTNSISFKGVNFKSDVSILSRDRSNTGVQHQNNYSDLLFNTLTDNDVSIGVKKLSLIADANIQRKIYTANSGVTSTPTLAYDATTGMYSMANPTDIVNSNSKAVTLEFDFAVNNLYSCDFQFTVPETSSSISIGVTTSLDGLNWSMYSLRLDGTTLLGVNNNGVWSAPAGINLTPVLNDAYLPKTGYIVSARPIGNNKLEIYLNGVYLETITIPFAFTKIGFGMFTINAAGQGLQNTQWGRIVTGKCLKSNVGNTLKIAAFGDSITFGEGSLSWAEYLPKFLTGQKGITKVSVSNYANSGNTSTQQLTKIQSTTLTNFDMVLILIGTNDIQGQVALATFKSNVQSMITLAKSTYRKVVIGIPPMWIDETLTGTGANTSHYEKGAAYRSVIMQLAAINDIYIADTMSEIGRIGVDNVLNTLRDNLHPNGFGEILLSRCFARSILAAVTADA
jgi:lysophospholipase L1-like esterase